MRRLRAVLAVLLALLAAPAAAQQLPFDDAYRDAMAQSGRDMRERIARFPPGIAQQYAQAGEASRRGDRPAALAHLRSMARARPDDPAIQQLLARGAHLAGDLATAEQALRAAIRIDPKDGWPSINLAGLQAETGQPQAALATLDALQAHVPDWSIALNLRAALLDTLGRSDDALAAYARAVRAQPASAQILVNQGELYERLGRRAEAARAYAAALRVQPDYGRAIEAAQRLPR
ncbi:tetratricopeptide repeat protein [Bordetella genomosp. 13]|uniref:tetratricopeptide repeat protein n=1 Tax=Bordetella genomosp. 13 TaxID=463040 RepID=UPI001642A270|nr:tetratricopeptide repeat protein [Bordetella genomosp. 13]